MKVLINTPLLHLLGGVANHYSGLKRYWSEKICYLQVGRRNGLLGCGVAMLPVDIVRFILKLILWKPDIVLLNPSLSKSALVRDLIFLIVAKFFGRKVAVFIHGFDEQCIPDLNLKLIVAALSRTECIFVLAERFRLILKSWGVSAPILLTTTKVDDRLLDYFSIERRAGDVATILFLARTTKEKGLFVAIEAFALLKKRFPFLKMKIVGSGSDLMAAKSLVDTSQIKDVVFTGALMGADVAKEYMTCDLYLFPSFHEGMPTSVLEAMAFGLPVITRPVGGLVDFFENGRMGVLVDSLNPADFAAAIEPYILNQDKTKSVSQFNAKYAREHFMASAVAKRMEDLLKQYI